MTFELLIITSKPFWLLPSPWHHIRVTYLWCKANYSHWNHCTWYGHRSSGNTNFWFLKKVLLFYRSMLRLSSQRSCDHIQWFQWLQVVIHHRYVTLVWCYIHWSSQKCLEVMHKKSVRPLYINDINLTKLHSLIDKGRRGDNDERQMFITIEISLSSNIVTDLYLRMFSWRSLIN